MISLILSILLPLLILSFIIYAFILFFIKERKNNASTKGTLLFQLDIQNKRIKQYDRISNKVQNKYIYNRKHSNEWVPLSELTKNFKDDGKEEFERALIKATNEEKVSFGFYASELFKNHDMQFKVVISKFDGVDDHTMRVSWEQIYQPEEHNVDKVNYTKTDIVGDKSTYKGFLGFVLDMHIHNVQDLFARDIAKIFSFKQVRISFMRELAIIPFFESSKKNAEKKMKAFINTIKNHGYRLGINRLTFGSAQLLSEDIFSLRNMSRVIQNLEFLIYLSIKYNEEFIGNDSKYFLQDEFTSFAANSEIFRQALKEEDIKTNSVAIRKYKSKRKIIEYAFPAISGLSNDALLPIIKNDYNKSLLINAQAKKNTIGNDREKTSQFLIDININWLYENRELITSKNAIYVLNFRDIIVDEHLHTIIGLKEKGFSFALRLKGYSEAAATLIMRIKPRFVVIDKELSLDSATTSYVQVISIKKVSDNEGSKVIFENLSHDSDYKWVNKIGLEYHYEI